MTKETRGAGGSREVRGRRARRGPPAPVLLAWAAALLVWAAAPGFALHDSFYQTYRVVLSEAQFDALDMPGGAQYIKMRENDTVFDARWAALLDAVNAGRYLSLREGLASRHGMEWFDQYWDPARGLLRFTPDYMDPEKEAVCYASISASLLLPDTTYEVLLYEAVELDAARALFDTIVGAYRADGQSRFYKTYTVKFTSREFQAAAFPFREEGLTKTRKTDSVFDTAWAAVISVLDAGDYSFAQMGIASSEDLRDFRAPAAPAAGLSGVEASHPYAVINVLRAPDFFGRGDADYYVTLYEAIELEHARSLFDLICAVYRHNRSWGDVW